MQIIKERYADARRRLAKAVRADRASAKAHGKSREMRVMYLRMVRENHGFNMRYGVGRCPKPRVA